MQHQYIVVLRETDHDSFSHLNHARIVSVLEEARWALLRNVGLSLSELRKKEMGPVILSIQVQYKKELVGGQTATIVTQIDPMSGKIGWIDQTIFTSDKPSVLARIEYGIMDFRMKKLVEPPDWWNLVLKP